MSTRTTLTMSDLIDETLDYCNRYSERPAYVVMGSSALDGTTGTTFTLTSGSPVETDVLEFDQELVLITDVSADADPIFTCARGYLGTTKTVHATGDTGGLNPMYPRYQIQRAVQRCFARLNKHLPFVTSDTFFRETGSAHVMLDETVVKVLEVGFVDTFTGKYEELGGWLFVEDLPVQTMVTGKLLRVPAWVRDDLGLVVKYQVPYTWLPDPATELSAIDVSLGSEELPVLFAAARLVGGREISRSELDKVEEWNHEAAIRGGVNIRLLQTLWNDYYSAVAECRSLQNVPKHRPYRKMHQVPRRRQLFTR